MAVNIHYFTILLSVLIFLTTTTRANHNVDSQQIVLCFEQARVHTKQKDSFFHAAEKLSKKYSGLKEVYDYNLAKHYILTGEHNLGKSFIEEKIKMFENARRNMYLAKYYNLLASIYAYSNSQEKVVELYKKAISVFEANKAYDDAAMVYFNLSNIFLGRLDYLSARNYIKKSRELLDLHKNKEYNAFVYSLLSITSLKTGENIDSARYFAEKAKVIADDSESIQAVILANYALGESYNYEHDFKKAIEHLSESKHLAERFNLINIALSSEAALIQSYINLKDYKNAILHGKDAIKKAEIIENNEIKFNLYKNTSNAYAQLNDYETAYRFSKIALDEYINKVNLDNQKIIQDYLVQYETEKKENLILMQNQKLKQQQTWNILLSSILLLSLMGFVFYRKLHQVKNLQLKEEKEKEVLKSLALGEEKERKKIAKELHDGMASQLTAIKLILEGKNKKDSANQKILQIIKEMHKEVRALAHSILPINFEKKHLHKAIQQFCHQINSPALQVFFYSNIENLPLENSVAHSLYRATQEIIQNAMKHAQAASIHVQFIQKENALEISIEDDGIGFDRHLLKNKNTLHFLTTRLELIDAKLELESKQNSGTIFNIIKTL